MSCAVLYEDQLNFGNNSCFYLSVFFWGRHQSLSTLKEIFPVLMCQTVRCPLLLDIQTCNHNKFESFDDNIWALAVTTLTTKASTRYIHSPLRCIRHISSATLKNQWAANYLWKTYIALKLLELEPTGDSYKRLTTQIMHSQHLQSDMPTNIL